MIRYALFGLLATTALMPVAALANEGWYAGLAGGWNLTEDGDAQVGAVRNELEFNNGMAVSGSVGYKWDMGLRTELEVPYRKNNIDRITGTGASGDQGYLRSFALMANVLYDFDLFDMPFTPYVGAGAGWAHVKANDIRTVAATALDGSEGVLAWQGIAGVAVPVMEQLDLTADYRYFATQDPEVDTVAATAADLEYDNHSVFVGLRYRFGGEPMPVVAEPAPAAPPPVAKPMVQAPPPAPTVAPTYMVFFDWDQAAITPEAERVLQTVANTIRNGGNARIVVTGHADRSGATAYNQTLSDQRADAVRNRLSSLGVADGDIVTSGMGEDQPLVPTADGVREAQNRRAEIIIQ